MFCFFFLSGRCRWFCVFHQAERRRTVWFDPLRLWHAVDPPAGNSKHYLSDCIITLDRPHENWKNTDCLFFFYPVRCRLMLFVLNIKKKVKSLLSPPLCFFLTTFTLCYKSCNTPGGALYQDYRIISCVLLLK